MKKFYLLLLFMIICPMTWAMKFEEALMPCNPLMEKAQKTNNSEDYIKAYECAFNIPKKNYDPVMARNFDNNILKGLTTANVQRYQVTNDKKYMKKAKEWANLAITNKTTDIELIQASIKLSSMHLDTKSMIKAYDRYCEVDREGCNNYLAEYQQMMNASKSLLADKSAARKQKIAQFGYILGAGLSGYGQSSQQNKPMYFNSTTTKSGNTYYTNTYSY